MNELKNHLYLDSLVEVSKEDYYDALECLPPMYFSYINGIPKSGFANSEPYYANDVGYIYSCYFEQNGKYYSFDANIKSGNHFVIDSYQFQFSRGLEAITLGDVATIKCTSCAWTGTDRQLEMAKDPVRVANNKWANPFKVCPGCKTDDFLKPII